MGLFNKMFKSERDIAKKEIKKVPWNELEEMDALEEAVEASKEKPVAILKHSTRCGISRMVMRNFEEDYDLDEEQIKLYYLDILRHRDISNRIAEKFNITHESPQLIVLKNGEAVYDVSHNAIEAEKLREFID